MTAKAARATLYLFLGLVTLVTLFPVYWIAVTSIKPPSSISDAAPIPTHITWSNFAQAFTKSDLPTWLGNTAIIAFGSTALGLLVCSLAAFGFARYDFAGKRVLFGLVIATLAVPNYVTLIPVFLIERQAHMLDTYPAAILPLAASALALFLLRQFFGRLPQEIFDAARVDGASEWTAYWRVALPLARPGLATAGLLLFLDSWNAYLLPLIVLRSPGKFNLAVGISETFGQLNQGETAISPWAIISVAAVISIVPLAVCLAFMQRHFIAGLTSGAVR
jgi:ABC-type glycerol-3-phosphate transport system permease component